MKISQKFGWIKDTYALMVVAGKQTGIIYHISNGSVNVKNAIRIETPRYSDREGFFATRHRRIGTIRSGSVYENKKQVIESRFLEELIKKIKGIPLSSYEQVFLFAPKYLLSRILQELPRTMQHKVTHVIAGTYTKKRIHELLQDLVEIPSDKLARSYPARINK